MPVWPSRGRSRRTFPTPSSAQDMQLPARNQIATFDLGGTNFRSRGPDTPAKTGLKSSLPPARRGASGTKFSKREASLGIRPCGLGARDTLRLEMCYPLNGSDLSPEHNPLEAGLGFFVDLTKPSFTGREKLLREKEKGCPPACSLQHERQESPAAAALPRFSRRAEAGELTSGTLSPSLNYGIGMAYLTTPAPKPGEEIEIEIRGQKFPRCD